MRSFGSSQRTRPERKSSRARRSTRCTGSTRASRCSSIGSRSDSAGTRRSSTATGGRTSDPAACRSAGSRTWAATASTCGSGAGLGEPAELLRLLRVEPGSPGARRPVRARVVAPDRALALVRAPRRRQARDRERRVDDHHARHDGLLADRRRDDRGPRPRPRAGRLDAAAAARVAARVAREDRIAQSYPSNARERLFDVASYLLIRGGRTYVNLQTLRSPSRRASSSTASSS
jgi:hypothetical protein